MLPHLAQRILGGGADTSSELWGSKLASCLLGVALWPCGFLWVGLYFDFIISGFCFKSFTMAYSFHSIP